MTLSMDRFSEIFDFGDIAKTTSPNDDVQNSVLIHNSSDILGHQSCSAFDNFSDSGSTTQSFSQLLEDKTMLDMDILKQQEATDNAPGSLQEELELHDFPFDEVLSLGFDTPTNSTSNESPQPSPEWNQQSPIEYNNPTIDCPLTPEKIAKASFDFKKLSYEKLNPIKSPLIAADYNNSNSPTPSPTNKVVAPKHLLPPGGVKITRYPMKRHMSEVNSPADIDQNTALILRLQRELKSAKQDIIRYQRSTEDWKNTAHYALQTAKRIKAQLDAQNKNPATPDSQKPGIFSPNFPFQTTSLAFSESSEVVSRREAYKRRSTSEPVTPIQCKISRLNAHISSRDVALLIKSSQSQRINENMSSGDYPKRKQNNTLSNNVKLALRAKVCKSSNNDSSNTGVFDIYKEVKELLNDVTSNSASSQQSTTSMERERVSSFDESWSQKTQLCRKRSFSNSAISHMN